MGHHHHLIRGGLFALLACFALIFALAAVGTNIASWGDVQHHTSSNYRASVWEICGRMFHDDHVESCYSATDGAITCTPFKDRFRAMQCFYILTILLLLISIIFAVLDHGNVRNFKHYKVILLFLGGLAIIFSLMGWSLAFSIPRTHFCESSPGNSWEAMQDQPNFTWGPSPFLMLIVTLSGIAMFFIAWRAPTESTEDLEPLR
jgi:MFS superfamily sulfate permease-like transporter